MSTKHTKGPWVYNKKRSQPELQLYRVTTPTENAAVFLASSEADALLIAAAPEMLEALKGLTRIVEALGYTTQLGRTQGERLQNAKSLIKKAEGNE